MLADLHKSCVSEVEYLRPSDVSIPSSLFPSQVRGRFKTVVSNANWAPTPTTANNQVLSLHSPQPPTLWITFN